MHYVFLHYGGDKMAEGEIHKRLKQVALRYLKEKITDLVCTEVPFGNAYSVADAVGINFKREEVRIIECKATKKDFLRDKKLFGQKTSYFYHAHYAYIMCPTDVIQPEEIPYGYGLLWVDEHDNVTLTKKPFKNTARLKTLFKTTMRKTAKCLTNQLLFKDDNIENKDLTHAKYSRRAMIQLISTKCPICKKTEKYLIHIHNTKNIKCSKCSENIDLTKAKIREITGFNKKFIQEIKKLNGEL